MTAHTIYDCAVLGSVIRYSDGTAKPPVRFRKKLSVWESRNGTGRLVKKEPPRERPTYSSPACFTLHEGDFGQGGIIVVSVRVLQELGDSPELLHLARDREAAERWLASTQYSRAYLEEVSADEVGADVIEGRAAA